MFLIHGDYIQDMYTQSNHPVTCLTEDNDKIYVGFADGSMRLFDRRMEVLNPLKQTLAVHRESILGAHKPLSNEHTLVTAR